jgi:hypothetical protein
VRVGQLREFATTAINQNRRLAEKYSRAKLTMESKEDYVRKKIERAMVDLVFMVGRLRRAEDFRILANAPIRLSSSRKSS